MNSKLLAGIQSAFANSRRLGSLGFCLAAMIAPLTAAEWDAGGGVDREWREPTNWVGDTDPAGTDVLFGEAGLSNSSATPTNIVDSTLSIQSLLYQYQSATDFHTTEIVDGVTLNVGGTSLDHVLQVGGLTGTGTPVRNTSVVIRGEGTLNVVQSGGSISIANHRLQDTPESPYTASLDMSGLAVFQANLGSTGSFNVGASLATASSQQITSSTVRLAGENVITAGILRVGSVIPNGQVSLGYVASDLYLGTTNTLNVDAIHVGRGYASKATGLLAFDASVLGNDPEVIIRGADGTSAVAEVKIGANDNAATSNRQVGSVDFSGGTVDALITDLLLGVGGASGTGTTVPASGSLTMDQGKIVVANAVVGRSRTGSNPNATNQGIVNIHGGEFQADNLVLAERIGGSQKVTGTLNISGSAEVTAANGIVMGSWIAGDATTDMTATVNVDGGSLTVGGDIAEGAGGVAIQSILNLRGGSLDLAGNDIAVKSFQAESGTLKSVGELNNGGDLVKTTSGTLVIEGSNTYTGETVVEAGTVILTGSLANGNVTVETGAGFDLQSTGSLQFQITDIGQADLFTLNAGGTALFDGTLNFDLANVFDDASWNLFSGTSAADFNNLSGIHLSNAVTGSLSNLGGDIWGTTVNNRMFEFDAASGMFSIATIPEPSAVLLLLVGGLGLLARRRIFAGKSKP